MFYNLITVDELWSLLIGLFNFSALFAQIENDHRKSKEMKIFINNNFLERGSNPRPINLYTYNNVIVVVQQVSAKRHAGDAPLRRGAPRRALPQALHVRHLRA